MLMPRFPCLAVIARIRPLFLEGDQFVNGQNRQVAALSSYPSGEPLDNLMGRVEVVIVDGLDSQVLELAVQFVAFHVKATLASEPDTAYLGMNKGIYVDLPNEDLLGVRE